MTILLPVETCLSVESSYNTRQNAKERAARVKGIELAREPWKKWRCIKPVEMENVADNHELTPAAGKVVSRGSAQCYASNENLVR